VISDLKKRAEQVITREIIYAAAIPCN